jgi:hypothetical protein
MLILTPLVLAADLSWHQENGWRWAELPTPVPTPAKTGFTRLTSAATGLTFTNFLSEERGIANRNLLNGSGVAAADIDGDGLCDLFFCGLGGHNALYRNLGQWRFQDITAASGVACPGQDSTGTVFADINADGSPDLFVSSLGNGVRLFLNDGKGHFTETTDAAGLRSQTGSMSLALADLDGDGDLDLYVVNYRTTIFMDRPQTTFQRKLVNGRWLVAAVNGVPATAPDLTNRFVFTLDGQPLELGEPDVLYLNDGQGHFRPLSWTDGTFQDEDGRPLDDAPRDWGLSVQIRDLNEDGAPDLYVCNDLFSPDRIWLNDGHCKFRALSRLALRTTSTFSMGVDFADINRDGHSDFMVADMLATSHKDRHTQVSTQPPELWPIGLIDNRPQVWRNTLQLNRGDGTFAEVAHFAGVEASNWSWMPLFLDVDLDGYEDLLIPNGMIRDFQNVDIQRRLDAQRARSGLTQADITRVLRMFPDFRTPSLALRNRHDLTFEETGVAWGFATIGVSQGTTLADLDGDGDLDVVVNRLGDEAGVFRNDTAAPRLAVRLRGQPGNGQGIGARLLVHGGPVTQSQEVICGGHYLSAADPLRVFAAGTLTNELRVEVIWRNGRRSEAAGIRANRICEFDETGSREPPAVKQTAEPSWFEDVSRLLGHQHHEDPFDDFERQPLLPYRLSQLGPGIAWHDLDGDGWEDLIIATGKGGTLGVYRNDGHGGFSPLTDPTFARRTARDLTAVLGLGNTLLAGAANYEDGLTNGGCLRIFDFQRHASGDSVLGQASSAGPLALGDVEGQGTLSLFIGGRVVPGRYPEPATSLLLRTENGRLTVSQRFERIGLVSGAVFSDLDGDGRPELILACEWGPIRVFRFDGQSYQEITATLGLAQYLGWWTGVTTGDLNGDGRLDIIATNWGLNHKYRKLSREHPRHLYYGDLQGRGAFDLLESYFVPGLGEAPERGYIPVVAALPFLQERIPTFEAYGTSTLADLYGVRLKEMRQLEVNTLASMVFFNRGDHFAAAPLPSEAQLTPAFGVCVADLDGDGAEDVLLSQNFFATAPGYTRHDAGRGLVLRGDGQGGLIPVPGQESGVRVYGEQRGCAIGDYDHDGRADLAITQNGNTTALYHNTRAKPGLRVRVRGGPGNPDGIGTVLRVGDGQNLGPAREIHAGSGYWSTDAPVQVMTRPEPIRQLWARLPGGKVITVAVPPGARAVELQPDGTLKPN